MAEKLQVEIFPELAKMPVFWANFHAKESVVINQGGTSSGKSHALIRLLFVLALMNAKTKIEIVAATIPKLDNDTLEIAIDLWTNNRILRKFIRQYNATKRIFHFKNGSKMLFKSYATPKDADGPKRHILYISEARNFDWAVVEQLLKRTTQKTFIDYNPVEQFWCHDRIINCPPGRNGKKEFPSVKVIRSWHIHNNFLSEEMHESIENIRDPELHKAYARGLTARVSGMCYPAWVEIDEFPCCERVIWGYDIGYTNDPSAVIKVGIKPYVWAREAGKMVKKRLPYDYVFDEMCYAPGVSSGFINDVVRENGYIFGQPMFMDHDKTARAELRSLGINAIFALKGEGTVEARVLHLRTRNVAYTKRSENIKEEKKRYYFFKNKDGHSSNRPNKGFDHAMNACEYPAFTFAVRTGMIRGYSKDEPEGEAA